jgi:hypothetical protein
MKRILLTGLAAIAALGLSCAREAPVYNQREVVGQNGAETVYKEVHWDSSHIELSVIVVENGFAVAGTTWTRQDIAGSTECAKVELYDAQPLEMQLSETETATGILEQYFSDVGCDRTFEDAPSIYVFSDDPAVIESETRACQNENYDRLMQKITD